MYIFPCKDCPDRAVGCHSKCEKYLAAHRENEKLRAEVFKIKGEQNCADDYRCNTLRKIRTRYEKRR
jgi:hypothetical protein